MHEQNFTERIVEAMRLALEKYPDHRPRQMKVSVGAMLHLVPESVLWHFEQLIKGTPYEGMVLDLVEAPVLVACHACAQKGGVEDHHLLICKACGSNHVTILEGDAIRVESLDLETPVIDSQGV